MGGSIDPALNSALSAALKQARRFDVPSTTIQRALNKASGQKGSSNLQSVLYEALIDGKVALLIECLTDNTNRAKHSIRNKINDIGARVAPVAFMFTKKARILLRLSTSSQLDEFLDIALANGVEDVEEINDGTVEIIAPTQLLAELTRIFTGSPQSHELIASEFTYLPNEKLNAIDLDIESRQRAQTLVKSLLEDEDCVSVYSNLILSKSEEASA